MTNLVLVDLLSEELPEQVELEQVPLGQVDLGQVLLGQVDLDWVHWNQQKWDLLVGLEKGLQVQGVVLVDLPFLRTFNLPYLIWSKSMFLFSLLTFFSIV